MLDYGLIGCGCHAQWAVLPALQNAGCCRLKAVADISETNLAKVNQPGVAQYRDYAAMLAREKLEAVFIATPVEVHAAAAVAALAAGCHVLCEKPMANSVKECRQMEAAARKAGRILAIDFESRGYPFYRQVRQWIADGHIGAIRAVHIDHMWDGHKSFGQLAERRKGFLQRSGCLDCGIHMLDITRFLCGGGEWQDVRALGAWFGEEVRFPPHIAIQARLTPGVMVTLNASFAYGAYMQARHEHESFAILGLKGVIAQERDAQGKPVFRLASDALCATVATGETDHAATIPTILREVDRAAHEEPGPFHFATGHDGLMAQVALDAANRSAVDNGDTGASGTVG